MKKKSSNQFNIDTSKATDNEKALFKQLKDVTDDVRIALNGGINIVDNLNMDLKSINVDSGKEISLGTTKFSQIVGAIPVETGRSAVTSYSTRRAADGTIAVTLSVNPTPTTITFLLFGG